MRSTIFYFSTDDQGGMCTRLFMSREALAQAIHASVEALDAETASAMQKLPFESAEWSDLWCEHLESQEKKRNYFRFGFEELEVSPGQSTNQPPEKLWKAESHELMEVPVISTAHITKEDREVLLKADPRDVIATFYDSMAHIVHSLPDEPINEAFPPDRFSEAFRAMFLHFRKLGFEYVRLDAEGPVIPELPTFN